MANYVDRDLLLKVLTHRVKGNEEHFIVLGTNNTLALVEEWVRSISAVDAVPVVRCKDCKYLYNGLDDYCCISHRGLARICENSFCSYGERKDNGV